MYVVTVSFSIHAAHYAAFMRAMVGNARTSLQDEPGCRQFDVCESPAEPGKVFLYEVYNSEADFQATLDIVRATNYAMAYSFKYSRRPGTPAATMEGQVEEAVMNDRLQRLQALLNEQQQAFNAATVGRTTRLLLERKGKLDGQLIGKSPWLQSVHVIAPGLAIGDMVDVDILSAGPNSLGATVRQLQEA